MPVEENKAVVRKYFEECWNKGNLAAIEECMAPQVFMHGTKKHVDQDWWRDAIARHLKGFPDFLVHVEHVVAEGDIVAANIRFTGTHRGIFHWGPFGPWEPTGKCVDVREMDFFRFAEGKVVEWWIAWDRTTFVRQLEVVDLPPAPTAT